MGFMTPFISLSVYLTFLKKYEYMYIYIYVYAYSFSIVKKSRLYGKNDAVFLVNRALRRPGHTPVSSAHALYKPLTLSVGKTCEWIGWWSLPQSNSDVGQRWRAAEGSWSASWANQEERSLGYQSLTCSIKPFKGEISSNKWRQGPWGSKWASSGESGRGTLGSHCLMRPTGLLPHGT